MYAVSDKLLVVLEFWRFEDVSDKWLSLSDFFHFEAVSDTFIAYVFLCKFFYETFNLKYVVCCYSLMSD